MKKQDNLLPKDGEVYFHPNHFSKPESDRLFKALHNEIEWKQEPIFIFGKQIMQPRLTAWYGDEGRRYSYSGITMTPHPWTDFLIEIKESVETLLNTRFNSALLNQYRDCPS